MQNAVCTHKWKTEKLTQCVHCTGTVKKVIILLLFKSFTLLQNLAPICVCIDEKNKSVIYCINRKSVKWVHHFKLVNIPNTIMKSELPEMACPKPVELQSLLIYSPTIYLDITASLQNEVFSLFLLKSAN